MRNCNRRGKQRDVGQRAKRGCTMDSDVMLRLGPLMCQSNSKASVPSSWNQMVSRYYSSISSDSQEIEVVTHQMLR